MNLRSVKTILLGGMSLLVATLPIAQVAQVSADPIDLLQK